MPTATNFNDLSMTNLGPLTTTWTAPAACATAGSHLYFADKDGWESGYIVGSVDCSPKPWSTCLPSGTVLDSIEKDIFNLAYFSPGVYCPSGWTTAGTLSVGKDPAAPHVTGILAATATQAAGVHQEPSEAEVWSQVLAEDETLVYCCPSGYVAGPGLECLSWYGDVGKHTEICRVEWPFTEVLVTTNTAFTYPIESPVITGAPDSTVRVPVSDYRGEFTAQNQDIGLVSIVPGIPLIRKASDVAAAEKDKGNDKDGSKSKDSAASLVSGRDGPLILGVILASVLTGALCIVL